MAAGYGSAEDDTEEQILEDYLLYYGDWYVKPEEYRNKYMITGIKPDNTEERVWPEGSYSYTVTANGNYTFKATNANGDKGAITVKVDNIIQEKYSSIYSKTELYTDKNGKTAWIPKGFAVGTNKSKNIEIDTVTNGLVITDAVDSQGNSIGNEFVWVPVNITGTTQAQKEASFEAIRTDGYYQGSLQTLVSNGNILEPLTSGGYDGEVADYNAMRTSIIEYGGFYIGRYEAGSETRRYDTSNGTTTMSVKRGKYPYNYVAWGSDMDNYTSPIGDDGNGAVFLSKNMYTDETKFGVTSTLCYGIQWDAIMKFVEDSSHSISNSTSWGNYSNSSFKYTGAYCNNPNSTTLPNWYKGNNSPKTANNTRLLTTGASETNKAKNIYDLAGNVNEWTMEAVSSAFRVYRGGFYNYDGGYYPASNRNIYHFPTNSYNYLGFRPALYIK